MDHFGALIIFSFVFIHAKAQEVPNYEPEVHVLHPIHPSLVATIGVLAIMLFLIILILAYAKLCNISHPGPFNLGTNHDQTPHGLVRSRSRFSGFDKTVIESLPFFRFSSLKGSKEGLECAVCLSKFEDTEILRLLPKCKHAFHMSCIDQWLESHSSCPLCRHKFDAGDVSSFAYSSSLRFSRNPSNLTDDPNLEIFVQRSEQGLKGSSRFSSFRGKSYKVETAAAEEEEELTIQECSTSNVVDGKILHKFKHKIIVSDAVIQNRWSDVTSSDLLFLNSEMMNVTASERFSTSGRIIRDSTTNTGHLINEQMRKIKEDFERKRLLDSKFNGINRTNSVSSSNFASTSTLEEKTLCLLDPAEKRSKSEITNIPRFMEFSTKNSMRGSPSNVGKEERVRRLWLPIALRTVQWFAGRERSSQEREYKRHQSNV